MTKLFQIWSVIFAFAVLFFVFIFSQKELDASQGNTRILPLHTSLGGGTSEHAASFINSTLRASLQIPFRHISEVIRTAHTPGRVDDVDPRVVVPAMGRFATKEKRRVWTVLWRVGDLCFCLCASFKVVRVVLKICIRSVFEGVEVNRGSKISISLMLILDMEGVPCWCDDSFLSKNNQRLD